MKVSLQCLLFLCCWLQLVSVKGQSACPDEYSYTFQPPEDVVCNPYINSRLSLDCAAIGPGIAGIVWYFSNMSVMNIYSIDTVLIAANSSKYTLFPVSIQDGIRVKLAVNNLTEADDTGSYWCRATLDDGQLLSMSGFFELQAYDMYPPNFPCPPNAALKNSDIHCASIFNPETTTESPSVSSSTLPPSTFHTPSPTPSITDEATTDEALSKTNTQTVSTDKPSFVETSTFVLYAVLGLVGLLGVVCMVLVLVILLLCRRRCRRIGLEGSDNKESAFEQLSNQSDMALLSFKRNNHTPFHPDISMQIPGSRNASGDYAEIGPVLMTLHAHNNNSNSASPPLLPPPPSTLGPSSLLQPQTHSYSEIRQLVPHSNVNLPPIPQTGSIVVDPYHITGYENPYDVPLLPTEQQQSRQISQTALVTLPTAPTSPDSIESVDSHQVSSSSRRTHDYQILERMVPVHHEMSDTISESSSFSTPPLSPNNYHTLEDQQVSQDFSRPISSATTTATASSHVVSHDFDQQSHDSLQLSCDSIEISGTNRLPTIPEHPYNISEEDLPTALEQEEDEDEDSPPVKLEPTPTPTRTMMHTIAVNRSDIVTPSYTDPEISEGLAKSFAMKSSKDSDEQEYDRLIDPTHLYHILEHSSNRPRLRELANRSCSHLEPTKQATRAGGSTLSPTGKGRQLHMTHLHFHNPHIDRMTADSPTSDSSLDDDKAIFDDPQYQVSPLKRRKPPLIRPSSDWNSVPRPTHILPSRFLNIDKDVSECSASELAKYRGDYERDPSYMLQLKKKAASRASPDSADELDGAVSQDTCSGPDDSGFLTFSGSTSPVISSTRRASMSDLPHVYQALETSTLNTLQPYERICKK